MRISIFGLGYVGAVCAGCLSARGHEVIGVDVSQTKIDLINQGKSPIVEPGLAELLDSHATAPVNATVALDDAAQLADDITYARRLGFGGKLCIHPSQIAPVHAGFAPSEAELAWASRVVAAAQEGAATRLDGAMVDRPVLLRAQRLLAQAKERWIWQAPPRGWVPYRARVQRRA